MRNLRTPQTVTNHLVGKPVFIPFVGCGKVIESAGTLLLVETAKALAWFPEHECTQVAEGRGICFH